MQVKLTVARVGNSFAQRPGEIIDVSPDEGTRMIAAGQAVPAPTIRAAVIEPEQETATIPRPVKGRIGGKRHVKLS